MYLSRGSRLTLIKSTLSSLPRFFLLLYHVPTFVAKWIEKLQRDFLWGGLRDDFKYNLVNWKRICEGLSWRKMLFGGKWWTRSTELGGVDSAQWQLEAPMIFVYGSISKGVGVNFLNSFPLKLVMVSVFAFA